MKYHLSKHHERFAGAILVIIMFITSFTAFSQEKTKMKNDDMKMKAKGDAMDMSSTTPLDTLVIERVMGMKGKFNKGEYKVTIPQNDLSIDVDGFKIIPAMGLGTWIDFAPSSNGAMIMGDLVLTETDLKPVQREIIRQGLTITAIHNHFVRNHPNVMYMHVGGSGNLEEVAQKAKAVLDKIKEVRGEDPSKGTASSEVVQNTLDTKSLDDILGYKAEMSKGVYKYTIGRPDVQLKEHGITVTTFMGFNTWAAFQGTPEHAAVAGDFTMLENEVAPVIKALVENGIEVVAVHNHMIHEQPRIFFLHYWGVGNAEQLAKGLKAALDQTGKKE
ncbi:MAG TPA: DUF1259 domain-containing protein [Flavisolibacter sp.]|jgi:hypothetical protein|nr:DUF1259 domain-containing protein [Flavisolibacter sp.]